MLARRSRRVLMAGAVLSHNRLADVTAIAQLRTLHKLSLSHNRIAALPGASKALRCAALRCAVSCVCSRACGVRQT